MRTPIGARYGTVSVTVDNSTISGMLDILKKANPFHGNINKKGDCRIKGELTTLMRTIPYNATGRIHERGVSIKAKGGTGKVLRLPARFCSYPCKGANHMRKFYQIIVNNPKKIIICFVLLAVVGAVLSGMVGVNYNMTDFLPEDTASTVSLEVMEEEFEGGIPNAG